MNLNKDEKNERMDELFKITCQTMCTKCRNYVLLRFDGREIPSCACNMEPTKCVLNKDIMKRHFESIKED